MLLISIHQNTIWMWTSKNAPSPAFPTTTTPVQWFSSLVWFGLQFTISKHSTELGPNCPLNHTKPNHGLVLYGLVCGPVHGLNQFGSEPQHHYTWACWNSSLQAKQSTWEKTSYNALPQHLGSKSVEKILIGEQEGAKDSPKKTHWGFLNNFLFGPNAILQLETVLIGNLDHRDASGESVSWVSLFHQG